MAGALHLWQARGHPLAADAVRRDVEAGDQVTVVLLDGAEPPDLPAGVRRLRLPGDLTYAALLDLVFEADRVIAW
jgi:hypothetical protein